MQSYKIVAIVANPTNGLDEADGTDELKLTSTLPFPPNKDLWIEAKSADERQAAAFQVDEITWISTGKNDGYFLVHTQMADDFMTTPLLIAFFTARGWDVELVEHTD